MTRAGIWLCISVMAATSFADDWPQWRGMYRDGKSAETGLLKAWPKEGPKLVRTLDGIGLGYSSPVVAGGRIYITGALQKQLHVFCLNLDGTRRWDTVHGPVRGNPPVARSTPTVEGDALYVVSAVGKLAAFTAATGKERWSVDFLKKFGGRTPRYAFAESALIVGDKLICQPGGPDASIIALNKKTGETIWTARDMNDTVTYCSAILEEIHGVRQIVVVTEVGVVGVEAETGRFLWRFDKPYTGARNCLTPIRWQDTVFAESGHRGASSIVRVSREGEAFTATPVWESPPLESHVGGHVGLDGHVYGHDGRAWVCREMATGKELYRNGAIGNGSTLHADGRFYSFSNRGVLSLIEADRKACKVVSSFTIPNASQKAWARLAIADGTLFVRNLDKLFLYALRPLP